MNILTNTKNIKKKEKINNKIYKNSTYESETIIIVDDKNYERKLESIMKEKLKQLWNVIVQLCCFAILIDLLVILLLVATGYPIDFLTVIVIFILAFLIGLCIKPSQLF